MLCGVVCVSSKSSNKSSRSKSVQDNLESCAMSLGEKTDTQYRPLDF